MPTNIPQTAWRDPSGNGEFGTTSGNLVTLDGLQLVTLAAYDLVVLDGSYTPVPATQWDETVETVPATPWQPASGLSDFSSTGMKNIVDTDSNQLVDTAGNNIVDTGVIETLIPATGWIEDDSL